MKKMIREILDNSNGTPQILWLLCVWAALWRLDEAKLTGTQIFIKQNSCQRIIIFFKEPSHTYLPQKTKKMYIMTSWLVLKQGFQVFFFPFSDLRQLCKYLHNLHMYSLFSYWNSWVVKTKNNLSCNFKKVIGSMKGWKISSV